MKIRLAGVRGDSIVDGPGLRFTVFAQGCPHRCRGCHNPHTHDFTAGREYEIADIVKKIEKNPLLDGVTFSGGEPFAQAGAFAELARALGGRYPIFCYTGYRLEALLDLRDAAVDALLAEIDVLVDGEFLEQEKSLELKFKGSRNQRTLDCKESFKRREAIILDE